MKRLFRRTGVGTFGLAVVSTSLGCSAPAPPPKVLPKPPVVVAAPPPPPPLPPARWMQVAGATVMGPQIDGGTLMLVGGRRVLLATDGTTKSETAPAPEPLQEVIVVPLPGGGKRLIARGTTGIYRLEDPLGAPRPLAQSESEIRSIGGYVGLVVVWTFNTDAPRFIDVDTGKFKLVPTLPALAMRAVAFRNEKEGAALFDGVGLSVTGDGGATWKRVTDEVNGDALRMKGIVVRDGALRAYVYEDGRDSAIDIAQARVARSSDAPAESSGPALVRWIRATGTDPIAAAALGGVELADGTALVANNGLLAKVDLKTGTIVALEEFAREPGPGTCTLQRAGNVAWLGCPIGDQPNSDVYDAFGIMRVQLDGSLKPDRPAIIHSGDIELRTSASGGAMILAPCSSADDGGEVCARQPDGRWLSLSAEVELSSRATGPLSDGRVAFLRNMWDGDKPESANATNDPEEEPRNEPDEGEEPGEDREEREDRVVPEGKRVYIAAVGENHKEERIATIAWRPRGDLRVHSPIQEDNEHNLHLIVGDDEGLYTIVQPLDKEPRTPQRIEGMIEARLRGMRGVAVSTEGIRATTDGGRTWAGVPLPTRARDALTQLDSLATDPTAFGVSEVGMLLDKSVRIGWGSTDTFDEAIEPVFDVTLPAVSRVSAPEKLLTCTVEANVQGTPPLTGPGLIGALLNKKQPPAKGTKRLTTTASAIRDGVMGVVASFDEEGPDKPGALPAKWTFNWFDPAELGGKPRTWTGAAPKDSPWGMQLRNVAGSGTRALFTLRISNKNLIVRTKGASIETAEVTPDLLPSNEVVFGTEKGEPIAWLRDHALIVWLAGEAPRVVGYVSYRSSRTLGEPTKDGIPVMLNGQDWSALRVFPIPPLDKKGPPPAPLPPTLEGWSAAPNLPNHVGRFPVCTAKPKGALHFSISRTYARASVDTNLGSMGNMRYEVYSSGVDACVGQVSATYSGDRSSSRPPPAPANAPKKAVITFVRADFTSKKAEGGTRGLPAKDVMHKLTCTLEERK